MEGDSRSALFNSMRTTFSSNPVNAEVHRSLEPLNLIWIDPGVENEENRSVHEKLRTLYGTFKAFTVLADGLVAIQKYSTPTPFVLVVSGSYGREIVPKIHPLEQVLAIVVFCMRAEDHKAWAEKYPKIKAVVVDLDRLASTLESQHAQWIEDRAIAKIKVPCANDIPGQGYSSTYGMNHSFALRYSLNPVHAGDLEYMGTTIENLLTSIIDKHTDVTSLLQDMVAPVLFLLKRRQNLTGFINDLKTKLCEVNESVQFSQRHLIDTILINSDRFLSQNLIYLLSRSNPVPMIQPKTDLLRNPYRCIMNLMDIWDYDRPILLSFGIGSCKGKSQLLNYLFESNFEESIDDLYFQETADLDFGYGLTQRRAFNIADVHGEMSVETLNQISVLFQGFLIHIAMNDLIQDQEQVLTYVKSLSQQTYIQLIVRDVRSENDPKLKAAIEKVHSYCSICHVSLIPNVADKTSNQNRGKLSKLRDTIRQQMSQLRPLDAATTRHCVEMLLDQSQKEQLIEQKNLIRAIENPLIIGNADDYPLYLAFVKAGKIRLEIAKIDPYSNDFTSEKLFQLNDELFNADSEFKRRQDMGPNAFGSGFQVFLKLLQRKSCLSDLHLLSMELQRRREKSTPNSQVLPFYQQPSLDLHWRNITLGSSSLPPSQQQIVINAYRDYIDQGNPFEVVDGDNFEMQGSFLLEVFKLFPLKKFFVISVLGPQNSGKSTLLNLLFGTSFEARDGRCTKGVYGALINVRNRISKDNLTPLDYDYILVIDTEGIMSVQKDDERYDQSLILFCLAVSHLVIVNVEGEISEPVKKYFLLCIQALKYLGETRVTRPTVHFVLNKRKDPNVDYCKSLLDYVRQAMKDNQLDGQINLKEENVHILPMCLSSNLSTIDTGENEALSTAGALLNKVQKLCHTVLEASSEIIKETGDQFCVPINWINFAYRVLQTIRKHPSMTYFKHVFERNQYKDIREDIHKDLNKYLSPTIAAILIERAKNNDDDHIKDSFIEEYNKILKLLEENHKQHCDRHEATENIRERSLGFLKIQLRGILRSWEFSALMEAKRHKIEDKVQEIEKKLREKAMTITHKNHLMDRRKATAMFNEVFRQLVDDMINNEFQPKLHWKQCMELVHHLCDIFDMDALPSMDNLLEYLDFLVKLDPGREQRICIKDCLSWICAESKFRSKNVKPMMVLQTNAVWMIRSSDTEQQYKYLNSAKIRSDFQELLNAQAVTRDQWRKNVRERFPIIFEQNWKSIVRVETCFDVLTQHIEKCIGSQVGGETWNEIKIMQDFLGAVNEVIKDLNNDLKVFGFVASKEFSSSLYIHAFLAATLHYYNQQKNHFVAVIETLRKNASKLIDKYIPWVIIIDNDDENVASNFLNELSQVILHHSFNAQLQQMINEKIDDNKETFYRSSIIRKLDDQTYRANDDWLMLYILEPEKLIVQQFKTEWLKLREKLETDLNNATNKIAQILSAVFQLIEKMNIELQKQNGHSLSFTDQLLSRKGDQNELDVTSKKFCVFQLFYNYFLEQPVPKEMSTRNGSIYSVEPQWTKLINNLSKPSEEVKTIFRLMKDKFETASITYIGLFLEKILKEKERVKKKIELQMESFIEKQFRDNHDRFLKQIEGCGRHCPACKRICDVDHHLDTASPVGKNSNRHRCQSGHQIRAMGGIRYEFSNEASLMWCGLVRDNDKVITSNGGVRQLWKEFKEAHLDWDFDDEKSSEGFETRYLSIWKRIGRRLCLHFVEKKMVNEMKYVEQNSPSPINHFILALDHSGSMNENVGSRLTPWENLLDGVRKFIDIRKQQHFDNDLISVIIFANRVEQMYDRETLARVDVERLNIPMARCGEGTKYSPAFRMVIKTLKDANKEPKRHLYRQTIIFMTDGEPQDDSSDELQELCDWREGIAIDLQGKALINNFWIVALGDFNQTVIKKIRDKIKGKLVKIDHPEDLVEAYANFAEIIT